MSALTNLFSSLANKIRTKLNTSQKYTPAQAIAAIDDVYTKGVSDTKVGTAGVGDVVSGKTFTNSTTVGAVGTFASQEKTVTAGTSAASVTPDSGKYLSKVTYNPTPSQTKSASPSTSAQTISPDSGKLLSSVSISAISPVKNNVGEAAIGSGVDSTGPFVWIPYGWYAARSGGNPYIRMTAAQAVAACPKQEKSTKPTTRSSTAATITPDSGKLLSKVTVNTTSVPNTNSGTYSATSRGASLDMGVTNTYRYVNTNKVPNSNSTTYNATTRSNSTGIDLGATNTYRYVRTDNVPNRNSGTYTFPVNDTGGTKDLTVTNTIRYVNAVNVYNKGKKDGASSKSIGQYKLLNYGTSVSLTGVTVGSFILVQNEITYPVSVTGGTQVWSQTALQAVFSFYKATATTFTATTNAACYLTLIEIK